MPKVLAYWQQTLGGITNERRRDGHAKSKKGSRVQAMIDYITESCEMPPLNRPEYDDDTGTWDLYFAEKEKYCPYNLEQELICIPFDTLEEAQSTLKRSLELYHTKEQESKKDINDNEPSKEHEE